MKARIEELRKEVENYKITDADTLEQFRITYLSKKGLIPSLFEGFRDVAPEAKKEMGVLLNDLKQLAADKFNGFKETLARQRLRRRYQILRCRLILSVRARVTPFPLSGKRS